MMIIGVEVAFRLVGPHDRIGARRRVHQVLQNTEPLASIALRNSATTSLCEKATLIDRRRSGECALHVAEEKEAEQSWYAAWKGCRSWLSPQLSALPRTP